MVAVPTLRLIFILAPFQNSSRIDRPVHGNKQKLFGGVTAKEGVGLPAWARRSVCGVEEQAAGELLVKGGGLEIDGLIHVVAWGVVAVGEPIFTRSSPAACSSTSQTLLRAHA